MLVNNGRLILHTSKRMHFIEDIACVTPGYS